MSSSNNDKPTSSGHGKSVSNKPEGPEVGKQVDQAKGQQQQSASLKQDPPTESGTGKNKDGDPHGPYDKMERWKKEAPREEPWNVVGYFSRGHQGRE